MSRVYQTAIAIGATISKAFKSDTLGAAAALNKLTGAAKQLKSAEQAAASFKKLNAAVDASKARYNQASEALRRLEAAERAAGGATKESAVWRKAGEREVARYAKEMDRATKAAEKNAAAMRSIPALRFAAARERIFGAGVGGQQTPLFQKAGDQARGIARDVAVLGSAAFGASAAIAGLVMHSLKAGDEIGDTADKLGIGAKALQELRFGAEQSGAEAGALDKALGKMAVTIGKFKNAKGHGGGEAGVTLSGLQMLGTGGASGGSGAETDPYKRIGLSAKQLANLKPEEQFKRIADGMAKLKTHADRAAVAQAIFGKGATEILPFLEEGSAGIDKLAKAANKYGGIMSPEALKNADEADKAMKQAKLALFGVSNTLGAALLPTATKVFTQFSGWVAANRGEIQKWASSAATWIEGVGIPSIIRIASAAKSFGDKVSRLVSGAASLVGGFDNLAIAIAALRFAPLAVSMTKLVIEGAKMAPMLVGMAAPFAAVAVAAGAVGTAIWRIVDAVKELGGAGAVWQDIKDFVASGGMPEASAAVSKGNAGFAALQAENARNLALARERAAGGGPMPIAAAAGGGVLQFAPTYNLGGDSKNDISKQMDAAHARAKAAALEALERRQAQQQRVAFSE
jgi:hypothetical protein